MPVKELIAANKITETLLVPHLKKKVSGGRTAVVGINRNENVLYGLCGENINVGDAVYLADDGKIYQANALQNKPAFAFAQYNGEPDDKIPLITFGKVQVDIQGDIDTGNYVFLRSNGQVGSIERTQPGDIIQILGTKLDDGEIIIDITGFWIVE